MQTSNHRYSPSFLPALPPKWNEVTGSMYTLSRRRHQSEPVFKVMMHWSSIKLGDMMSLTLQITLSVSLYSVWMFIMSRLFCPDWRSWVQVSTKGQFEKDILDMSESLGDKREFLGMSLKYKCQCYGYVFIDVHSRCLENYRAKTGQKASRTYSAEPIMLTYFAGESNVVK